MKKIILLLSLYFVFTNAFSQITNYKLRMEPDSARIMVANELFLKTFQYGNYEGSLAITLGSQTHTDEIYGLWDVNGHLKLPEWTVNGIVNGNNLVGQIILIPSVGLKYIAPLNKPDKNPVEVMAAYKDVYLNGKIFDTTLTCHIEIGAYTMRLDPDTAWLRINDTLPLRAVLDYEYENKTDTTATGIGWSMGSALTPNRPEWTVNGIVNGNNLVGQIIMNGPYVTFKAPFTKPVKNPVEVIAAYKDVNLYGSISDKKLTSTIYIVESDTSSENDEEKKDTIAIKGNVGGDRFEVNMVATITGGSPKAWTGIVTYRDEGSFVVSLEKNKPSVINIINKLEVFTNNCLAKTILNPATCTGLLHVAGTSQIKITPANPPGQPYPIVEIFFVPYPIELTRYTQTCPPPPGVKQSVTATIDLSNLAMMAFMGKPAIPQYLKFIAKEGEQIILESPKEIREIYYKIWVRKVRED